MLTLSKRISLVDNDELNREHSETDISSFTSQIIKHVEEYLMEFDDLSKRINNYVSQ
jgi:hypothetical protein